MFKNVFRRILYIFIILKVFFIKLELDGNFLIMKKIYLSYVQKNQILYGDVNYF